MTETLTRWKLGQVPCGAARGNSQGWDSSSGRSLTVIEEEPMAFCKAVGAERALGVKEGGSARNFSRPFMGRFFLTT